MLAKTEDRLLHGSTTTIEGTYTPKQRPSLLGSVTPFLRVCCEELNQYFMWPVCYSIVVPPTRM
jgi:hypothetical protein